MRARGGASDYTDTIDAIYPTGVDSGRHKVLGMDSTDRNLV